MVRFVRINRQKNEARFYNLYCQVTLFNEIALVREWGRIGGASRQQSDYFATEAEAQGALERASRRREQRGLSFSEDNCTKCQKSTALSRTVHP